jgi:hypothetical protein
MSNAWEILKAGGQWAAWLPAAYYEFVRNYPGCAALLWPLTLALAVWWL